MYARPTQEFLSFVKLELGVKLIRDYCVSSFRMFNDEYNLFIVKLTYFFGVTYRRGEKVPIRLKGLGFDYKDIWNRLTGEKIRDLGEAKSSHIYNPCFYYVQ